MSEQMAVPTNPHHHCHSINNELLALVAESWLRVTQNLI